MGLDNSRKSYIFCSVWAAIRPIRQTEIPLGITVSGLRTNGKSWANQMGNRRKQTGGLPENNAGAGVPGDEQIGDFFPCCLAGGGWLGRAAKESQGRFFY